MTGFSFWGELTLALIKAHSSPIALAERVFVGLRPPELHWAMNTQSSISLRLPHPHPHALT